MFDINFFIKVYDLKLKIINKKYNEDSKNILINKFDNFRSKEVHIFNLETTNYCNMKCVMCPRTTLMTRKNEWIDEDTFNKIVNNIEPHSKSDLLEFNKFIQNNYKIFPDDRTEDSFFYHKLYNLVCNINSHIII